MAQYFVTAEGLQWLQQNDLEASNLYLGFIDSAGLTGLSAADTMLAHAGWTEFTSYTATTRPAWVNNGSSGGYISNTPGAQITLSAHGEIVGFFLTDSATKGGTTNTLIAEGLADIGSVARAAGELYTALLTMRYQSGGG